MTTRKLAGKVCLRALEFMGAAAYLVCLASSSYGQQGSWAPKELPIGFWCSPPEPYVTIEQYKLAAAAGFSVVMPPCEGAGTGTAALNHKILDLCRRTGMKAIIGDSRMPLSMSNNPHAGQDVRSIVSDYRKDPALLGYFVTDEPGADAFAGLSEVQNAIHKLDPDHLVYVNLFPNYASTNLQTQTSQLNADTYDQYLTRFMRTVNPDVLSWDNYFFLTGGDRPGFLGNLAAGQRAAAAAQPLTPFWQVVLSVQHGPYRALNENELRFEAMQTLVYGAHGLVYFTYWPPSDPSFHWSNAIMNRDGSPGPLYEAVKSVNHDVRTLAKYLYRAQIIETFQSGAVPPDGAPVQVDSTVKVNGAADLSVGTFRDIHGYVYVLFTNRDYRTSASATAVIDAGSKSLKVLDIARDRWDALSITMDADGNAVVPVNLAPAAAMLIRWQ